MKTQENIDRPITKMILKTVEPFDSEIEAMLQEIRSYHFGFITEEQVQIALKNPRYRFIPCLVRLSSGLRFQTALQYVKGMVELVNNGGDFVRDVSLNDF